jgi:hypothetical protein
MAAWQCLFVVILLFCLVVADNADEKEALFRGQLTAGEFLFLMQNKTNKQTKPAVTL